MTGRRLSPWGLIAALVIILWAPPALADDPYGVVTIDLRPPEGELPTHVCVVSAGEGPRTRKHLSEVLEGSDAASRPVSPEVWGGGHGGACGSSACAPRVQLNASGGAREPEQLHVACTADTLTPEDARGEPRVAFLLLEHLEGSPPRVESVNLTGGVLTVGVEARLDKIIVTARSLGGHYAAARRAQRGETSGPDAKLIVLPLTPRCRWREVSTPGLHLREQDRDRLEVRAHGQALPLEGCVGPLRGGTSMRLRLPRTPSGAAEGSLEIERSADERGAGAASYGARWIGDWPERRLELSAQRLAFGWRQPACIVDQHSCPDAVLDGGVACKGTPVEGVCRYECPAETDGSPLELRTPVAVSFEVGEARQTWTEILQRPDQMLSGYVSSDQIYLEADVSGLETEVPGSRITHVEIYGNDGSTRRYGVRDRDSLRILVPGASCEPVRYRLVGDRRYQEASAEVKDGGVDFSDAESTARLMSFNLVIMQGGGPAVFKEPEPLRTPIYFVGQVQLAAQFRPRKPKWARIAGELRLGGGFGQWGYYAPDTIGDDPRRARPKIPWMRFLFEPAIVVDVVPPLSLSAGLGIGSSWPLRPSDITRTESFRPILSPSIDARFRVRRWLSFVLQGRFIFLEDVMVAQVSGIGEPEQNYFDAVSVLGLYGVQLTF